LLRASVGDTVGVAVGGGFGYVFHVIPFLVRGEMGRLLLCLPAQEQVARRFFLARLFDSPFEFPCMFHTKNYIFYLARCQINIDIVYTFIYI
jgi:hypothetical protein